MCYGWRFRGTPRFCGWDHQPSYWTIWALRRCFQLQFQLKDNQIVARAPMICRFPNYNTWRSPHFVSQSRSTDSAASCAVIMQLPKRQNRRAISCTECRRRKQKVHSSLALLKFLYQAKNHQLINYSVFRTNMAHVQIVLDDTPQ